MYDSAVAEREPGCDLGRVVEAVSDVEPFSVLDLPGGAGEVLLGREHHRGREALGQTSTGFGIADQYGGDRAAARLASQVRLDDGGRAVGPGHEHGCSVGEHHDGVRVRRAHGGHEVVVFGRECERSAVVALGLVDVGEPDEHDGHVGVTGEFGCCRDVVVTGGRTRSPAGEAFFQMPTGIVEPGGNHLRAACTLIPRLCCEPSDDRDVERPFREASSGSVPSFVKSTVPAIAARRASRWCSTSSTGGAGSVGASVRRRATATARSSTWSGSRSPSVTASTTAAS